MTERTNRLRQAVGGAERHLRKPGSPGWVTPRIGEAVVYFLEVEGYKMMSGEQGPVLHVLRIGWTSDWPAHLAHLKAHWHGRVHWRLLGVVPGGAPLKAALHCYFSEDRLLGDWFHPGMSLCRFLGARDRDRYTCARTRLLGGFHELQDPERQGLVDLAYAYRRLGSAERQQLLEIAQQMTEHCEVAGRVAAEADEEDAYRQLAGSPP